MKIYELFEARRNPEINNQRGRRALFDYLNSLSLDVLDRTYVHLSMINKVGVKGRGSYTGRPFEPLGVFTYRAKFYLKQKGNVIYKGSLPWAHVITVNSDARVFEHDRVDELYLYMDKKYPFEKFPRYHYIPAELSNNERYLVWSKRRNVPNYETDQAVYSNLRSKTTKFLLDQGYDLIDTNVAPGETVILNPRVIEKIESFIVEYIQPNEIANIDFEDPKASLSWEGSKLFSGGVFRHLKKEEYKTAIENKKILTINDERYLASRHPKLYQTYIDQVLTPNNIDPKISPQEKLTKLRKYQAAEKRLPSTPERTINDLKPGPQYNTPSGQSGYRLWTYAKNNKKQLNKQQEANLLEKGFFDEVDYGLKYYEMLFDLDLAPLLTYQEIYNIVNNRRDFGPPSRLHYTHNFLQHVKDLFGSLND